MSDTKLKTVQCNMKVRTSIDNFDLCSFIENVLKKSVLNTSEYSLDILETKVIKSDDYENQT